MSNSNPKSRKEWPRSARGLLALGIALMSAGMTIGLSSFALAATTAAAPAESAPVTTEINGGRLEWRPAESFAGDQAAGRPSVTAAGGAVEGRDGTVRFQAAEGTYDARTGVVTAGYRGTVVLTYPDGEVTLADPTVVIGPEDAALRLTVDANSADPAREAEIGDLKTFGIAPETVRRTVTWSEVPVTLTAAGAEALPGAEFEGVELGPMTIEVTLADGPAPAGRVGRPAGEVGAAATTAVPSGPAAVAEETVCPSPSGSVSAEPSVSATPTPSPTETSTASPSGAPTSTACPTPPGDGGTAPDSAGGSPLDGPGSGGGDSLAKTGSALIPLMALGGGMTVAGGGIMLTARRRAFPARA